MLDVKPVLSLDLEGRVIPVDRVRGREQLVPRVLALLEKRLTPRPRVVRFGVVHTEAPEMAERALRELGGVRHLRITVSAPGTGESVPSPTTGPRDATGP